jgi:hypothetical protein
MFHGVHDEFKWLETPAMRSTMPCKSTPAVVTHKNIAVTSLKLRPVEEKWLRECRVSGSALYLPLVDDPGMLPYNVFDEWYIFSSAAAEKTLSAF